MNSIDFNEAVIIEGDSFFKIIDKHIQKSSDKDIDDVRAMISSYSR